MADRLGIARSTYSMIERGARRASTHTIGKLSKEFCLPIHKAFELLEGKAWRESEEEVARHD